MGDPRQRPLLDSNARVAVTDGTTTATRRKVKFPGATVTDDPVNEQATVTISTGGWSDVTPWTPKLAALDYDTATWVEPYYGDPNDATMPAFQFGEYRTNGVEVAARAIIVIGKNASDQENPDTSAGGPRGVVHTDGFIYLSLPLASAETLPTGTLLEDISNYTDGHFAHSAFNGSANWGGYDASNESDGLLLNAAPSQAYVGTSFPSGPPADLSSWMNVTTLDETLGVSVWTWSGEGVGPFPGVSGSPYNYHAFNGLTPGMIISWNVRYFTT